MIKRLLFILTAQMWIVLTVGLPDGRVVEYNCAPHGAGPETGVSVVFEYGGRDARFDCERGFVYPAPWEIEVIEDSD